MPTGYTADIKDGISFTTFALNCARAFGACISLRDEPSDAAIPEAFEPSDWHAQQLAAGRERLTELEAMTAAQAKSAAAKAWDTAETNRTVRLSEIAAQRSKYEAMLAKVEAWQAPTPDHEGMKKFMAEQITQSIDFDCGTKYHETPSVRLSGSGWLATQKAEVLRSIEYHEREHAEEVKRCADRTAWVAALRASLAPTRATGATPS